MVEIEALLHKYTKELVLISKKKVCKGIIPPTSNPATGYWAKIIIEKWAPVFKKLSKT